MKVLKAEWKDSDMRILHGDLSYKGSLDLLVDEIPEIEFEQIGNYFYGEKDGLVKCYKHIPGTKDGFGGRTITIKFKDGPTLDFKGCLWDPFSLSDKIPKHFCVGITTDPEVMERGYTFYAGKITWKLAQEIFESLNVNPDIKRFGL